MFLRFLFVRLSILAVASYLRTLNDINLLSLGLGCQKG
jgi:hypothetical protein